MTVNPNPISSAALLQYDLCSPHLVAPACNVVETCCCYVFFIFQFVCFTGSFMDTGTVTVHVVVVFTVNRVVLSHYIVYHYS